PTGRSPPLALIVAHGGCTTIVRGSDFAAGALGIRQWEKGNQDMSTIGTVDTLWRYPVKSMRGEELNEAFVGFSGMYGDRVFAFRSSASPKGFPFLTAREQRKLLQYQPRFRYPDKAARPINLAEAESMA